MMGWQWHQLNHMQAICTSLQKITTPAPHQSDFCGPDALPDTQPTASKHWRPKHWRPALTMHSLLLHICSLVLLSQAMTTITTNNGDWPSHPSKLVKYYSKLALTSTEHAATKTTDTHKFTCYVNGPFSIRILAVCCDSLSPNCKRDLWV